MGTLGVETSVLLGLSRKFSAATVVTGLGLKAYCVGAHATVAIGSKIQARDIKKYPDNRTTLSSRAVTIPPPTIRKRYWDKQPLPPPTTAITTTTAATPPGER